MMEKTISILFSFVWYAILWFAIYGANTAIYGVVSDFSLGISFGVVGMGFINRAYEIITGDK